MIIPDHISRSDLAKFLTAAQQLRHHIAEGLAKVGLSAAEYDLLEQLHGGAWRGAQDLNAQLLQRLATRGLIRRAGHETTRSGAARLTDAGRILLDEALDQVDVVCTAFLAAFTSEEHTELARLLARIS